MSLRSLPLIILISILYTLTFSLNAASPLAFNEEKPSIHVDFDACVSYFGGYNADYSEFTGTTIDNISCTGIELVGGFVYRNNPQANTHSCTPGQDSIAMCVSGLDECTFVEGSDRAVRFDILVTPGPSGFGSIDEVSFYSQAPETFNFIDGVSGPNNYPTLMAVRVLANGVEVFRTIDIPTSRDWTLREFDFSALTEFTVNAPTLFNFEILPYCLAGVDSQIQAWDIDLLTITGGCNDVNGGIISTTESTSICYPDSTNTTISFDLELAMGSNLAWLVSDEDGSILLITEADSIDFSSFDNGVFNVNHIAYDSTDIQGLELDELLQDLEGCFDLSNTLEIFNNRIEGGSLTIDGLTDTSVCSADSLANILNLELSGNTGLEVHYILLDSDSTILQVNDVPELDMNTFGQGEYFALAVSHNGGLFNAVSGMSLNALMGCFATSNSVSILKALTDGGLISFDGEDSFEACETSSFVLEPTLDMVMGDSTAWILYMPSGLIVSVYDTTPIDISMMLMSSLRLVHIAYVGPIMGLEAGENINDIVGCFDLSNVLSIDLPDVDGGTISVNGQDSINVCLNDPSESLAIVDVTGVEGIGSSLVVTDEFGEILMIPSSDTIDFSNAGTGLCFIWNIAFANVLEGFEVGMSVDSIVGCFDLSNSIAVNRVELDPASLSANGRLTDFIICSGDGQADSLVFEAVDFAGPFSSLVVTDTLNNVLEVPQSDTIDFEGVVEGLCFVYHLVSTSDSILIGQGLNLDSLDGCYALSNAVTVLRNEVADGSLMTTDSLTEVFVVIGDGSSTEVDVILENAVGDSMAWLITDSLGVILELPSGPPFDFANAGPGVCLIWSISYNGSITGLEIGANASDIEGCFALSNAIIVNRVTLNGGVIEFPGGVDTVSICTGDPIVDSLDVALTGAEGPLMSWIITDTSGLILELPLAPPFVFDDTPGGTCLIWHMSYTAGLTGLTVGENVANLNGSFNLSNALVLERTNVNGGDIITTDSLTMISICTGDGVSDSIDIILDNVIGDSTAWVITDTTGLILELPAAPPFDFEGVAPGVCLIYHLAYVDQIINLEVDSSLSDLSGCYALSNAISVSRFEVDGGVISEASGMDTLTVVVGEGIVDSFEFSVIDAVGDSLMWVVTDSVGIILSISDTAPVEFESAGTGTCQVYHVAYGSADVGLILGADINNLMGCFDLSNNITVIRMGVDGGEIMTVDSLTLVDLCIQDSMSMAVDVLLTGEDGTDFQWVITDTSGLILELPTAPPFDFSMAPTGICQIWHLASIGAVTNLNVGANVADLMGIFDLSNPIEVDRSQVNGGVITHSSGADTLSFITNDGIADLVDLDLTDNVGDSSQWVITDTTGLILALPDTLPFDFEGSPAGICLIWNVSYNTEPTGLEVDSLVANVEGCFDLSNAFTVIREELNGGTIMTVDSLIAVELCLNDTISDLVDVTLSMDTFGMNYAWLITDTSGLILDLPTAPPFDFSSTPSGICLIWHMAYQDNLMGLTIGANTSGLTGSFNLSNSIEVSRDSLAGGTLTLADGTTSDTITVGDGVVDTISLDLSGAMAENNLFVITDTLGQILDTTSLTEIDLEGAGGGVCLIWNIAYSNGLTGLMIGNNVSQLSGCFDLSNPVTIVREGLMGGVIATPDGLTSVGLCLSDTLPDLVDVTLMNASGPAMSWVVTDTAGIILDLPVAPPFDLTALTADPCLIWHLSHDPSIMGLTVGSDVDSLVGNHHFSNSIEVFKLNVQGSSIMTTDSLTALTITVGEGITDTIDVISEGGSSDSIAWVITDTTGVIVGLPTAPPFDLEAGGGGVCLIWQINYSGDLTGLVLDQNVSGLSGCFELSNSIEVTRIPTILNGGFLTTDNFLQNIEICVGNGTAPLIDINLTGEEGPNFQWVISDTSGLILGLPSAPPFDLNLAGPGLCQIRNLAYSNGIQGLQVGSNIDSLVGFYDFSNPINVTRNAADGGTIQTPGGFIEVTIPVGEGVVDSVDVVLTGNDGEFQQWIVTDDEGNIIDLNAVPPFTFEDDGGGVCMIYSVSYTGAIMNLELGNNVTQLEGCFDLSNVFIVNKDGLNGGFLTTIDGALSTSYCFTDVYEDSLEVTLIDTIGTTHQWVVVNAMNAILGLPDSDPFDLTGFPVGPCFIYNIAYDTPPGGLTIGDTLSNLTGIYHLSNPLAVNKAEVMGGVLTYADSTVIDTIEVGEGIIDTIEVLLDGAMGGINQWVVTDTFGNIIQLPLADPFNFENLGGGTCLIWNINFIPGISGLSVGANVNNLDGCFSFSNPITLFKEGLNGGLLSFDDGLTFREVCSGDGIADSIEYIVQGVQGDFQSFFFTTSTGQIQFTNLPNPFNFEAFAGNLDTFIIYSIAFDTMPMNYAPGTFVNNLMGTFDLSNAITLSRNIQRAGEIEAQSGSTDTTLIVADGIVDTLFLNVSNTTGDSLVWVMTNSMDTITLIQDSNMFVIDSTGSDSCSIYHVAYDTLMTAGLEVGLSIDSIVGCHSVSNAYSLTKKALNGGTLTTTGGETSAELCLGDANADIINVIVDGEIGSQFVFIALNSNGVILLNQTSSQIDFTNVQPGDCQLFHLAHDGSLGGLANGVNIVNLSGCYVLSNPIDITKNSVFGGNLSFQGGGTTEDVCVTDGIANNLIWQTTSSVPADYAYALTDSLNVIDTIITASTFDFEGSELGTCRIWGISYLGNIIAVPGDTVGVDDLVDNCFDVSNDFLTVTKTDCTLPAPLNYAIYPNPVVDRLKVDIREMRKDKAIVYIIDSNGKIIFEEDMTVGVREIDLTGLQNGMYYMRIKSGSFTKTEKFVVIK